MGIGPLIGLASNYVHSLVTGPLSSAVSSLTTSNTRASAGASDSQRLSPFAQILGTLQQLQQSNPSQYRQVTQQIASKLQTAAQTATTQGDTTLASNLTTLSQDLSSASSSGQLPNIQDLAKAIGGPGHHAHHAPAVDGTQSSQTDPLAIISSALQSAGLQTS
jgi:hypothetical protein